MAPSRGRLLGYAFGAAAILLFLLHRQPSAEIAVRPAETALKRRVAICISGASRGDAALAAFAAALRTNLLEYQSAAHNFELYAWLESPPAEAQLLKLLAPRTVSTRASVVVPPLLRQPEDAAIAADHHGGRASARADAGGTNRLNTLRMLYKLRGVEYLRRKASSAHDLVLRIRPDLELLAPLTLPPAHEQLEVWMAWRCDDDEVASDQLLITTPAAAAELAALYEPDVLDRAVSRSVPPSMYPERLVYQHLCQNDRSTVGALAGVRVRLAGCEGEACGEHEVTPRDAFAKLRRDFPGCFALAGEGEDAPGYSSIA